MSKVLFLYSVNDTTKDRVKLSVRFLALYRDVWMNMIPMIITKVLSVIGNVPEKNEIKKLSKIENKEDLMVGSNVKVLLDSDVHYGVIRWIGTPPGISPGKLMAAVELVSTTSDS